MAEHNASSIATVSNYNHSNLGDTHMDIDIYDKPIADQMELEFGKNDDAEDDTPKNETASNNGAEISAPEGNNEGIGANITLFPALLNADPELASDAKKEMDAENKKRINTLRENGAKGGRPPIDRGGLAKLCLDEVFAKHGQAIARHYMGDWYLYTDGCYSPIPEEEIDKKLTGHLLRSGVEVVSSAIRRDVLGNLKSDALCGLTVDKYTKPCFISTGESAFGFVSMKNGIINIDKIVNAMKSGNTLPAPIAHTPDLFTTVRLPYQYDPAASCPKFMKYLEDVQPKEENREILQMLAGLLLTPDTSYNVAFFLYGPAGTGKSVFLSILIGLVGVENTCCVPLGEFANKHSTWPLVEKLLNAVGDMPFMPESGRSAEVEGVLKDVTSGGLIKIEPKFKDVRMSKAIARCVFATNYLPYFSDRSGAIRDRLRIIPFNHVFRNTDQQNPHLTEELMEELPGILNWALRGLVKLRDLKIFPPCEEGQQVLEEHLADCDHEGTFLRDETEANADRYLGSRETYHAYREWAKDHGYNPVGDKKFREAVLRVYPNATYSRQMEGNFKTTVIHGISWHL